MIRHILGVVIPLFPLSEMVLAVVKHSRGSGAERKDRGSMILIWFLIGLGVFLAVGALRFGPAQIPVARSVLEPVALGLMAGGLVLRWTAILALGRYFTVDVAVHSEHAVVESGLYRFMRHPSYTGLLIVFLGVGVFFGNWISLVALLVPITLGVVYRVAKEERALLDALGPAYASYCARTKRFVPWIV